MLEAQDKKSPGYSRFLVPGNEHGRDAHVTFELVKQLLNVERETTGDLRYASPITLHQERHS
jgi:hypothetical protein